MFVLAAQPPGTLVVNGSGFAVVRHTWATGTGTPLRIALSRMEVGHSDSAPGIQTTTTNDKGRFEIPQGTRGVVTNRGGPGETWTGIVLQLQG